MGHVTWWPLLELQSWYPVRQSSQNYYFLDDIFKCIYLNENARIAVKISLNFDPKVPINNIQAIAWLRTGDKLLSEAVMPLFADAYTCHPASMS